MGLTSRTEFRSLRPAAKWPLHIIGPDFLLRGSDPGEGNVQTMALPSATVLAGGGPQCCFP